MAGKFRPLFMALCTLAARFMFARYMLASACALCADMALFLALSGIGISPSIAAFAGYVNGLVLHWMLSTRFVFGTAEATHGQRAAFAASALLGLGITVTMVASLCAMGLTPALAKLLSIPVSFVAVYAIRKYGIFARA